ncbi:MAG: Hsp20/alpha crystallin family protein [Anaerolineales bacterium]|nr:Hsp20/alpha crystallin family protein [Anaerolineales bacterium]
MPESYNKNDPERYSDTDAFEPTSHHWRLLMHSPWRPPTDVFETEDSIMVRVEAAGMREDNFSVELNGRELLIRGVRQDLSERRAFHQMEIRFGEFMLSIELPYFIDSNRVEALYDNGFLVISLPKARPRQITFSE